MINNTASGLPTSGSQRLYLITERVIIFSLVMYALFAPHSIAITQGAFLLGLVAWAVQMTAGRNLQIRRTPVDIALLGFFACCVVSSFLSYDPLVSVKGLRSPAFFLAFYFVSNKVKSLRLASFLAFAIVASCLANVAYSAVQLGIGRGIRINSIREDSPFANKGLGVGDVIIEADGQPVNSQEELSLIIDSWRTSPTQRGQLRIKFQRSEAIAETSISRKLDGVGVERLGITTSPGRNFRVMGFYSHYETYAEVLQLIAALAVGMLLALPNKKSVAALLLGGAFILLAATLVMTSTRAAIAGLTIAIAVMAFASARRRIVIAALLGLMLAAPVAYLVVERSRGISVLDPEEGSTAYRLEVWREAFGIIKDHPLVGIGKGSEGKLKETWGLYEDGKLPPGHFHSTPIQIATWWGLPALILYFSMMAIFAVETWKLCKRLKSERRWTLRGIALGGLGALVAFNVSSLVHFNFGDGEVVMMFWLLAGLVFAARRIAFEARDSNKIEHRPQPPPEDNSHRNLPLEPAVIAEPNVRAAKARQN
ncbi:MAG TPA: O-antigen ligase family protein [Blastocatellia bacterium]|nr:O-antigen ligase family protein [Blastocatellia bacterium]